MKISQLFAIVGILFSSITLGQFLERNFEICNKTKETVEYYILLSEGTILPLGETGEILSIKDANLTGKLKPVGSSESFKQYSFKFPETMVNYKDAILLLQIGRNVYFYQLNLSPSNFKRNQQIQKVFVQVIKKGDKYILEPQTPGLRNMTCGKLKFDKNMINITKNDITLKKTTTKKEPNFEICNKTNENIIFTLKTAQGNMVAGGAVARNNGFFQDDLDTGYFVNSPYILAIESAKKVNGKYKTYLFDLDLHPYQAGRAIPSQRMRNIEKIYIQVTNKSGYPELEVTAQRPGWAGLKEKTCGGLQLNKNTQAINITNSDIIFKSHTPEKIIIEEFSSATDPYLKLQEREKSLREEAKELEGLELQMQ